VWCERLRDITDAARHRTAAERDHQRVEFLSSFEEFEAHGARSLTGCEVQAVLRQVGAFIGGDPAGEQPGVLDVVTFKPDGDKEDMTVSVPRPLKLRTGLRVSTLRVVEQPSASPRGAHSYCGELRNTGSIAAWARRIRSRSSRVIATSDDDPSPTFGPVA
jgi:hypothetical protein